MASAWAENFYNSYDASDADAGSYNQQSYGWAVRWASRLAKITP
jgi:hypothetical protein